MKWAIGAAAALFFGPLVFTAMMVGYLVQPWAAFWIGQPALGSIHLGDAPQVPFGPQPLVTDYQRYHLALGAGFSPADAITATAISIAENGGGNPAALSGRNRNGTYDLGLWQINTIWWPQFGGLAGLSDPVRNAQAAFYVYGRQGWCAWSVYETSCGEGHVGTYRQYINRAREAAR